MVKEKKTRLEVKKAILKMKSNKSGERSRWKAEWLKEGGDEMIESLTTIFNRVEEEGQIALQWRETSIKSLYKGGGSKEKIQESQRGIFMTNIVTKAYEIVKKIQSKAIQSNMSKIQTAGKKNRSTMDNIIIINAVTEKQRQSHKNTYLFFADAEKCFDKLWLKDCLIDMEEIGYSPIRNEQKSRNNSRYNSGSN